MRTIQVAACAGLALFQVADGMSVTSARQGQHVVTPSRTNPLPSPQTDRPLPEKRYYADDEEIEFEVNGFQELQRSTGSEILDDDLQVQIDKASEYPNLFLDAHVSDASYMEK